MQYYSKITNDINNVSIEINNIHYFKIITLNEFNKYNSLYSDYDFIHTIIYINTIEEIIYIENSTYFKKIKIFIFNYEFIDCEEINLLYFINKNCYIWDNELNINDYKKILLNPIISGIFNVNKDFIKNDTIKYQYEIENEVCHINFVKICKYFELNTEELSIEEINILLYEKLSLVFNKFLIYNIYNLPLNLSDENVINIYTNLASKLGRVFRCHPINDKQTTKSTSRQIKYDPNATSLHFYSSNSRQPLHNDYAYYEINNTPDWLTIFALKSAEYGGTTSIITNNKIKTILQKYNSELLEKINIDINYLYTDIDVHDICHKKKLFDTETNISNWNYFQIKEELNSKEVINIRDDYFSFLNNKITEAKITTLNKILKRGDCIILNDHLVMHERAAFFGERHLQDVAFYSNNLKLVNTI
jgi:hypothetical protein